MENETVAPKIDRLHSVPFNPNKWTDDPELTALCDRLYREAGIDALDKAGNRKPKRTAKDMLLILLTDVTARGSSTRHSVLAFQRITTPTRSRAVTTKLVYLRRLSTSSLSWWMRATSSRCKAIMTGRGPVTVTQRAFGQVGSCRMYSRH